MSTTGSATTAATPTRCGSGSTRRHCVPRRRRRSARGTTSGARCASGGSTLFGREVGAGEPAVHEERRRGHIRGVVRGQEQRGVCDLPDLCEAAHRQVHEAAGGLLRVLREQLL